MSTIQFGKYQPLVLSSRGHVFDDSGDSEPGDVYFNGVIDNLDVQAREPEQKLWRAVLAQTILDATCRMGKVKVSSKTTTAKRYSAVLTEHREWLAHRDEAIDWLTSENEQPQSFNWVAIHVFDVEPKVLRARIAGATPALQEVFQ